jgi:hypothetical protein
VGKSIADTSDISILQQRRNALEAGISSLTVARDNLVNLLSTAEIDESTKRHDAWYMEHREIFKALNSKILETRSERDEHSSIISGRSKSSRASSQSSVAKRAEMLTKAARLETELKFLKIEQEKAAEFKKIQLMKEIATNQAEIEAVTKLDEEHNFDLASNKESLLDTVVSSHERVQAYLENQIEAENIPVLMETNLSPPKIDDPAPQVSVPALNQGNLNPETKPFVPTPPATVQQANNAVSNPTLQPTPTEFDHDPHHNTSNVTTVPRQPTSDAGVLTRLVDLLSQRNNHDSLPRPEPEVFDGNLLRFSNLG